MNDELKNDEIEIDLREIFSLFWHKAWLILLSLIIGAAAAFGYTEFLVTPQYSATSMIFILTKTTSITSLADLQMGSQLTVDFQIVATSRPVVEEVIEKLNLDATYEELVKTITIENPTASRMLKTTVTNPDPNLAMEISNAISDATAEQVSSIMTTDKPTTVEKAVVPTRPSSPSMRKNVAIGGLLGAILMMVLIFLRFFMNDTIKEEEDVQKYLGLNTLAAFPLEKKRRRSTK